MLLINTFICMIKKRGYKSLFLMLYFIFYLVVYMVSLTAFTTLVMSGKNAATKVGA